MLRQYWVYAQQWTYTGLIARFGKKESISSNYQDMGYLMFGTDALQKIFQMTAQETEEMEKRIADVCKLACERIDHFGVFGDVGLDVIVDTNKNIWILEINKAHQRTMALELPGNSAMFARIMTKPIEYATSLAGFHKT